MYAGTLVARFSKSSAASVLYSTQSCTSQFHQARGSVFVHLEMFLRDPLGLHPCYSTCLSVVAFELAFLPVSPLVCPAHLCLDPAHCSPVTRLLTLFPGLSLPLVQSGFQCQAFRTFSHLALPYPLSKIHFLWLFSFLLHSGKPDFPRVLNFFPSS